ncbi:transcription initiation factor TFIID subunit 6-like isoform X3 [Syzygium oleosum]|uniref:transcription initiation factor TFIID subunit 6-like isoform X3 n=1 Tax=Syzygium oleosum TaxID=219896 RepID=UPI0024BA53D5|nr:transcription initiation factor TFIID subunit 6-like isoform X3 [Syzygium oleosum]
MRLVPKESIEVLAQTIGVSNLSPDVTDELASDVEYHLQEIMQEAIKCMRHSKRTALTVDDVDSALKLRNVEPIYGFASSDAPRFKRAAGHNGLFYIDEKDVEFKEVIDAPLPRAPLDTSVSAHWLAIEGVQPAIPENPPFEALTMASDGKRYENREDGISIDIKLPIKSVPSRELQLYFDKIRELTVSKSDSVLFNQALVSLATDSGLHPLIPYFTQFIADEVTRNLSKISLLFALVRVAGSLLQNPHVHIEPYLHQLMPSIITCLVTKRLGNRLTDNHWELRNMSASLVASICKRYGHVYHNLQPRVIRTLVHAFLDPKKSLPQHYGAIKGLAALGPSVSAAGLCMYNRLKMLPKLLAPPTRAVWKTNRKVKMVMPNKRRASSDNLMQQPPLKRIATEGMIGGMPPNPMQGVASGFSGAVGGPGVAVLRQLPSEGTSGRDAGGGPALKTSNALAQAWKEDVNAGHLLASLFEYFGESMFCFTPKPELSFFL